MIGFVSASSALLLLTLVILFWPFIARRRGQHSDPMATSAAVGPTQAQLNTAIYRDELDKLDEALRRQEITPAAYETARLEWSRRLLAEQAEGSAHALPIATGGFALPRPTLIGVTIFVLLGSVMLYGYLGRSEALVETAPPPIELKTVEKMVAGLAEKLKADPSNLKGWAMLARSYRMLGKTVEAEQAFDRAGTYLNQEPALLAEYAEVVARNANGQWAGKPSQILQRALQLAPQNPIVLWLAGVAAMEGQQKAQAMAHWEKLLALLPPDSEDAGMVREALKKLRD